MNYSETLDAMIAVLDEYNAPTDDECGEMTPVERLRGFVRNLLEKDAQTRADAALGRFMRAHMPMQAEASRRLMVLTEGVKP